MWRGFSREWGPSAQDSGQFLTFEGQTCSLRGTFTRWFMRAASAWNKQWHLVIEVVKCLSSFRIKGHGHRLPVMIGPCPSMNGQQADVDVRVDFLLRNAMQFSKSKHGHQMPGQRISVSLTWTSRGRRLPPEWCRSCEELLNVLFQLLYLSFQGDDPNLQGLPILSRQMSR